MAGYLCPQQPKCGQNFLYLKNFARRWRLIWENNTPIPKDWDKIRENNTPIPKDWDKIRENNFLQFTKDWDKIRENNTPIYKRLG